MNNPYKKNPSPKKPGKPSGFNLSWLYLALIAGLVYMLFQDNSENAGGIDKEISYTTFRTYVKQGVGSEVVVNKTDGIAKMVVKPEHIRKI